MAQLHIRLDVDPKTGRKNLTIGYESDSDALPMEHDEEHRRLVESLIRKGIVSEEELGDVVVERLEKQRIGVDTEEVAAESEGEKVGQGS